MTSDARRDGEQRGHHGSTERPPRPIPAKGSTSRVVLSSDLVFSFSCTLTSSLCSSSYPGLHPSCSTSPPLSRPILAQPQQYFIRFLWRPTFTVLRLGPPIFLALCFALQGSAGNKMLQVRASHNSDAGCLRKLGGREMRGCEKQGD